MNSAPPPPPPFSTRLRERLSPRMWGLEWLALAAALLGLAPQIWPMSMRERVLLHGEVADASLHAVTRIEHRNNRWGTDKKLGARLIVYHVDFSFRGIASTVGVQHFQVGASDAAKLGLDSANPPDFLRIRHLPPESDRYADEELAAAASKPDVPKSCRPAKLCERVLIDRINTLDAKKFGDRPEAGLTIVGVLVFAAMLAVRAIGLIMLG
jgi:hypothetical protein